MIEMQAITVEFSRDSKSFPIEAVQRLLENKKVLRMREHFFLQNGIPYLVFCIYYEKSSMANTSPIADLSNFGEESIIEGESKRENWRQELQAKDNDLFELLRKWRNKKAATEGYSRYIVLTNSQLVKIAHLRPQSLAKLESISGIGKSKSEKYGRDILAIVAGYELQKSKIILSEKQSSEEIQKVEENLEPKEPEIKEPEIKEPEPKEPEEPPF